MQQHKKLNIFCKYIRINRKDDFISIVEDIEAEFLNATLKKGNEVYIDRGYRKSLTQIFITVGKIAYEIKRPVCFIIDEMQHMKKKMNWMI